MEQFWRWLLRANARTVFLCALVGLLGVVWWRIWKEFVYDQTRFEPLPVSKKEAVRRPPDTLGFLEKQMARFADAQPADPFAGVSPIAGGSGGRQGQRSTPGTGDGRRTGPSPVHDGRATKPETVSLVYKGIMVLPDDLINRICL